MAVRIIAIRKSGGYHQDPHQGSVTTSGLKKLPMNQKSPIDRVWSSGSRAVAGLTSVATRAKSTVSLTRARLRQSSCRPMLIAALQTIYLTYRNARGMSWDAAEQLSNQA